MILIPAKSGRFLLICCPDLLPFNDYGSVPPLCELREARMDKKPENNYRVFAPGVPNVRVISERLTEADVADFRHEIGLDGKFP